MLRAGSLRHRIAIQAASVTVSGGAPSVAWATTATVSGSLRGIPLGAARNEQSIRRDITHEARIRYRQGISTANRLLIGGEVYTVEDVSDPDGLRVELRLGIKHGLSSDWTALLNAHGRTVVFVRLGSPSNTEVNLKAVVQSSASSTLQGGLDQDEMDILIGVAELTVAGIVSPAKNDRLLIDGVHRAIRTVDPQYEGETLVGYRLRAKG